MLLKEYGIGRFHGWIRHVVCFSALLISGTASADVPVSVGTNGALDRAARLQGSSRDSSAASFGTPSFDESRGFSLRLRIPLFIYGDQSAAGVAGATRNIIPHLAGATRSQLPIAGMDSPLEYLTSERLDELSSYIPLFKVGEEHKPFHFQLGAVSSSIGRGSIVHRFSNSPEGSRRRVGILAELNSASLGAQVMVADVTNPGHLVAGRIYGRPILWFIAPDSIIQPNDLDLDPRTEIGGIWVTGVTAATDATFDGLTFSGRETIWAAGWDNELALLDNKAVRAIFRLDLNMLGVRGRGIDSGALVPDWDFETPFGVGAHPGFLGEFSIPVVGEVGIEAEYNFGSNGYVPRYFDRLYFLDRDQVLGTKLRKSAAAAPASHGYFVHMNFHLLKTVSAFIEAQDQFAFSPSLGTNNGTLTVGGSLFFMMLGGTLTLSQAGVRSYGLSNLFGPGFIMTAEGRITFIANVLHLVARYYRVHEPLDMNLVNRDYTTIEGALVGLEINLDFNTPIALW